MSKAIITLLVIAFLGIVGVIALSAYAGGEKGSFDHSQCQYPYRTTNPSDSCDNSDPCDPESAAKGRSGACE